MTSTTSSSGFRRMSLTTLHHFSATALKELLALFKCVPGCSQANCSYDAASDIFEVSCPALHASEVFYKFTQTVAEFIQTEYSEAEENDRATSISRIPASCVDEEQLGTNEIVDLFGEDPNDHTAEDLQLSQPEKRSTAVHLLKTEKGHDFKLQFIQLTKLLDGTLSTSLVAPTMYYFDDSGERLAGASVCRYLYHDPAQARYLLQDRTLKPLSEIPTIDLWNGLEFGEIGTEPPTVKCLQSVPINVDPTVTAVRQWLEDSSTVDEDVYLSTSAGPHRPQALETQPASITELLAIRSGSTTQRHREARSARSGKSRIETLADTPVLSQPWALSTEPSTWTTGASSGWEENRSPPDLSAASFPLLQKTVHSSAPKSPLINLSPLRSASSIAPFSRGSPPKHPNPSTFHSQVARGQYRGQTTQGRGRGRGQGPPCRRGVASAHGSQRFNPVGPAHPPNSPNMFEALIDVDEDTKVSSKSSPITSSTPDPLVVTSSNIEPDSEQVIDRLALDDEPEHRVFHRTMRQRKPAPGPVGKRQGEPNKHTSSAEVLAGLKAWTLEETSGKKVEKIPEVLAAHPPGQASDLGVASPVPIKVHSKLLEKLIAAKDHGFKFDESSLLEMQFGRILLPTTSESDQQLDFDDMTKALSDLMTIRGFSNSFTSILSTSAQDMYYMLDVFGIDRNSDFEHWTSAWFDITCRKADQKELRLVVNAAKSPGSPSDPVIQKSNNVLVAVYLHFPQRMWDARLTVTDTVYMDSDEELGTGKLLDSLYIRVPDGRVLPEVQGRDGNGLFVESVRLTTSSSYQKAGAKTHITINRVLDLPIQRPHSTDVSDHSVFHATIRDEVEMVNGHRFWYEASLGIIEVSLELEANEELAASLDELEKETEKIVLEMDAVGLGNRGLGHPIEQKLLGKKKKSEKRSLETTYW